MAEEKSVEERFLGALIDDEPEIEVEAPKEEVDTLEAASEDADDDLEESEGGSEGEEEKPLEATSEPEFVEMEIDGVVYEVPKALEKGFSQEKDYTQKSQTLAEERKQVEFLQQQMDATKEEYNFAASIQTELSQIAQIDAYVEQASALNWQEMSTDEMVRAKHDLDMVERQKKALVEGLTAKQKEFQETQEQSRAELLSKGAEVLKGKIPGWNEAEQKEMHEYALSDGYTEQEISSITDPRFVTTLWKAKQFDKLKSGAESAKVAVKNAPTIKAKSRNKMPDETKKKLNLRKKLNNPNLSSKKKADLMQESIGDRFG